MRNEVLLLALLTTLSFTGCGGGSQPSALPDTSPLHGGILVPLPENQGYVELLNDKRERKGGAFLTTIVAYPLQADQKTAFPRTPTSVTVTMDTPKGKKTIPLLPKPDQGDSVGSARFVSDFGPYELNQVGGDITVAVDGKTL